MKPRDLMLNVAISGIMIELDHKQYNSFALPEHLHSEIQNELPLGYLLTRTSGSVSNGTTNVNVFFPLDKVKSFSSNGVNFIAPVWVVNLSNNPNTVLELKVDQNNDSVRVYNTFKDYALTDELLLPLQEPITLAPTTAKVIYLECKMEPINRENHYRNLEIRVFFTGIDQETQARDFRSKVRFRGDSFYLDRLRENDKV